MPSAQKTRTYSPAHFVLEIGEGELAGIIRSVEGGGVKSDHMTYKMGSNHDQWRQIGKPKYADLKIQFGMSMSDDFYDWIAKFFKGEIVRQQGAIVAGDFHYKARARRQFFETMISEIAFPTLDGGDKNACHMTATLVPEWIEFVKGDGSDLQQKLGTLQQKLWTAANFTFAIDGLAEACKRVTKVDGFTIKQQVLEYHHGNQRTALRVAGDLEFPNVSFYVPEADAQPFIDRFTKFALKGEVQGTRLNGSIQMNDNTGSELCTVSLFGLELAEITPDKADATADDIKKVKIEVAIERMEFKYNKKASD